MRVLVISTWGFPGTWFLAKYVPCIPPRCSDHSYWGRLSKWSFSESPIQAHSSTAALVKSLINQGYEVELVVYGLDTLAASPRPRSSSIGKENFEAINKLISSYLNRDPTYYPEVVDRARAILGFFVRIFLEEVDVLGNVKYFVEISPGVGIYRLNNTRRYIFEGSPLDSFAYILLDLTRKYLIGSSDEFKAVILDISHGVNYLPVMAVETIKTFSMIYSSVIGKVSLAIVNSDPVTSEGQRARINVVMTTTLSKGIAEVLTDIARLYDKHEKFYRMLIHEKPSLNIKLLEEYIKHLKLRMRLNELIKSLPTVLNYGLILYLLYMLNDLEIHEISTYSEFLVSKFIEVLRSRSVFSNEYGVFIKSPVYLNPDVVVSTTYLTYLLKHILRIIGHRVHKDNFVRLKEVKKIAEELGVSDIAKVLLDNEVGSIEKRVRAYVKVMNKDITLPKPYSLIYEVTEKPIHMVMDEEERKRRIANIEEDIFKRLCEVDKRNFYAHAGLERNVVEIMYKDNEVYIRYISKCLERIHRLIKS